MKAFNKIMGSFKKTVTKLEALEDRNLMSKIRVDNTINELTEASERLEQEADMAARTAAKIRAFYEVD